jgi:hypothetical protein
MDRDQAIKAMEHAAKNTMQAGVDFIDGVFEIVDPSVCPNGE